MKINSSDLKVDVQATKLIVLRRMQQSKLIGSCYKTGIYDSFKIKNNNQNISPDLINKNSAMNFFEGVDVSKLKQKIIARAKETQYKMKIFIDEDDEDLI